MEMITFRHDTKNPYSVYGIKYFLLKSGLSVRENINDKSKIEILYGDGLESYSEFIIHIKKIASNEDIFKFPLAIDKKDNRICIDADIFMISGKILSGNLEEFFPGMEKKEKQNNVSYPILDNAVKLLLDSILLACKELNMPLPQKTFWQEGKSFAVCLTHDVDEIMKTYQWITYPIRFARERDFKRLYYQIISFLYKIKGKEPYWTFKNVLDIESDHHVKSTFFFLNETGKVKLLDKKTWRHAGRRYSLNDPKVSGIIKELHYNGWDIGLHGSFYSYNNYKRIHNEKEALEAVLGSNVFGIRQHNLNLNIPETWLYQEKAGLEYDTTLGFNDCIGFRWGTCFPFQPFYAQENRALNILEIPLIIEDLPFFRYHNPWEEFLKILEEVEKHGGVLTLLWHHSVFNKYEFPGWSDAYEKIIEYCKKKNAWITSAREISNWWRWREKTSFEWEYEGTCLRITPYPKDNNHFLNIYLPEKMIIKKITNASVLETNEDMLIIRTNSLKNDECVEIEFSEFNHGN